jgi:type IV pilus assembly protein PilA
MNEPPRVFPPPLPPTSKPWVAPLALTIGVLAVMIPLLLWAYSNVRWAGEDKAILGQLRQISAAADQYFLENSVTTVAYSNLVGPTNYIKAVRTHEAYPAYYTQGHAITASSLGRARTITYSP